MTDKGGDVELPSGIRVVGGSSDDGIATLRFTIPRRSLWRFRLAARVLVAALWIMPGFIREHFVSLLLAEQP